jgi:hypothetical protein
VEKVIHALFHAADRRTRRGFPRSAFCRILRRLAGMQTFTLPCLVRFS